MKHLLPLAVVVMLSACTVLDHVGEKPPPPPPPPIVVATPTPGGIYSSTGGLALFEDAKARSVGDVLTVVLVENTAAQKSANTATSKDDAVNMSNISVLGKTIHTNTGMTGTRAFTGKGSSSISNSLSGSITVAVVERFPNGNLLVRGEKQLELNQGSEVIKVEGTVRPADIQADNSVTSDRVANAKVVYSGRGALADNNAQGWISRFFSSPWFPF